MTYTDAAWGCRRDGSSQGVYLCFMTDAEFIHGTEGPASPISWNSGKLPRVARSSLAAEIQAATDAQEESEFARLVMADLLFGPADLKEAAEAICAIPGVLILDCKALWDSLEKSESSALGMLDKRVAIEALALKRSLIASNTVLRWVHSDAARRLYDEGQ